MSEATPRQDPASDFPATPPTEGVPALAGSTGPKTAPTTAKKKNDYATATGLTIEILLRNLAQQREDHEAELAHLREEHNKDRSELQATCLVFQTKSDELNTRNTALAVENEGLATENAALRREQVRSRFLEFVAVLFLGVGGGFVSYASNQHHKDFALLALLIGGGVLAIHFVAGFWTGVYPHRKQ